MALQKIAEISEFLSPTEQKALRLESKKHWTFDWFKFSPCCFRWLSVVPFQIESKLKNIGLLSNLTYILGFLASDRITEVKIVVDWRASYQEVFEFLS